MARSPRCLVAFMALSFVTVFAGVALAVCPVEEDFRLVPDDVVAVSFFGLRNDLRGDLAAFLVLRDSAEDEHSLHIYRLSNGVWSQEQRVVGTWAIGQFFARLDVLFIVRSIFHT